MVNLKLGPNCGRAYDLIARSNARKRHLDPNMVAFVEKMPLALKNHIKGVQKDKSKKACIEDMFAVINCMQKFDKNQAMCSAEIEQFNKCFEAHRARQVEEKAQKESNKVPVGAKAKLSPDQLREYMKKFPLSTRTRQAFIHPQFKPDFNQQK